MTVSTHVACSNGVSSYEWYIWREMGNKIKVKTGFIRAIHNQLPGTGRQN